MMLCTFFFYTGYTCWVELNMNLTEQKSLTSGTETDSCNVTTNGFIKDIILGL